MVRLIGQIAATQAANGSSSHLTFLQPAIGITQIIVNSLLAFIVWRLTFIIFVRNAEQKIYERQAAWYHKVVVDPQLKSLGDFFATSEKLLRQGAESCENAKSAKNQAELDRRAEETIKTFNELLIPAQRSLSDTVLCFDNALALETREKFEALQDDVTDWFETLRQSTVMDARASLPVLLSGYKTEIIRRLRDFEFSQYGFKKPGLIASLLFW